MRIVSLVVAITLWLATALAGETRELNFKVKERLGNEFVWETQCPRYQIAK